MGKGKGKGKRCNIQQIQKSSVVSSVANFCCCHRPLRLGIGGAQFSAFRATDPPAPEPTACSRLCPTGNRTPVYQSCRSLWNPPTPHTKCIPASHHPLVNYPQTPPVSRWGRVQTSENVGWHWKGGSCDQMHVLAHGLWLFAAKARWRKYGS